MIAIKIKKKKSLIVFGGPQASATHRDSLKQFGWIDYIIRGEGENKFSRLISSLYDGNYALLTDTEGLSYRKKTKIEANPDDSYVENLDDLPIPAYHLYPTEKFKKIPLDVGRSCPFSCIYCSTSMFWKNRFRLKSIERIVKEITFLDKTYNAKGYVFQHDMFTANKKRVVALCRELVKQKISIKWGCAARADCIDYDLISTMKNAGCDGMYFGIESGSKKIQKYIGKNLNLAEAYENIEVASNNFNNITASFITGFPVETLSDVEETLEYSLLLRNMEITNQLHLLSPLNGTPLFNEYHNELGYDGYYSDVALFDSKYLAEDGDIIDKIKKSPNIFPYYYYFPTENLDRDFFIGLDRFWTLYSQGFIKVFVVLKYLEKINLSQIYKYWKQKANKFYFNSGTRYFNDGTRCLYETIKNLELKDRDTLLCLKYYLTKINLLYEFDKTSIHRINEVSLSIVKEAKKIKQFRYNKNDRSISIRINDITLNYLLLKQVKNKLNKLKIFAIDEVLCTFIEDYVAHSCMSKALKKTINCYSDKYDKEFISSRITEFVKKIRD